MIPSQFVNFLREALQRLKTKSPKWFFVVQVVFYGLAGLAFLPDMLYSWFGIQMNERLINICNKVGTFFAGMGTSVFFTSEAKTVAQTPEGALLKKAEQDKFPFTKTVEEKRVAKEEAALPVVPIEDPE